MNDYILYNELGRGSHTTVYKGRKKGHIDFVAICSYEKDCQDFVNNKVSILSQTKHPNVIQFYEWYETSSHFWVIEELCNGCSLAMAMSQDSPVPESLIKNCAIQLTQALYHIHSSGVIVRNLHPHKIFIDAKGGLKLGGLLMGCDLNKPPEENVTPALSPLYCCPEALFDNTWSYVSDLWSLGAILYHMFTGFEPFPGATMEEITERIRAEEERREKGDKLIPIASNKEKYLTLPGTGIDGNPLSDELHHLLTGLLDPNPETRLNWKELEKHPFFMKRDDLVHSSFFEREHSVDYSEGKRSDNDDFTDSLNRTLTLKHGDQEIADNDKPSTPVVDKPSTPVVDKPSTPVVEKSLNLRNSTLDLQKSTSSLHKSSVSARQSTATVELNAAEKGERVSVSEDIEEESVVDQLTITESMVQIPELSIQKHVAAAPRSKITPATTSPRYEIDTSVTVSELLNKYQATVLAQPIVGNTKIFKDPVTMRWEPRLLPWEPLPHNVLNDCEGSQISHHLLDIADFLCKKGNSNKELANCVGYLNYLASFENCVYLIVNSELLLTISHLIKGSSEDIQLKIVQVIGALIQNSTTIETETQLGDCVSILTDVLRDSSRSLQLRLYCLASLGELIFFIASQEEADGVNKHWAIPSSTFVCITRCLREGEEIRTQLCAAKIVENVCAVQSQYNRLFAQDHIALSLWKLHMKQAPTDVAYITFVRALTNMTKTHHALLSHVVTKIGLVNVLDNLNKSHPFLQKDILLFLLHGLNAGKPNATSKRIVADKSLLSLVITLLNSPHTHVKSFSAVLTARLLVTNESFSSACNQKLINSLDRELKRATDTYLIQCLTYLSGVLLSFVPNLLDQTEAALHKVENRRNPNSAQTKELNTTLTSLPTVLHLLTSRSLSRNTLSVINMEQLCDLLRLVPGIQCGETGLGSSALVEDTLSTLFSISEICLPSVGAELALPAVGHLCQCQGDYRGVAVQLGIRIGEEAVQTLDTQTLAQLFSEHILPGIQVMLLETPPLPTLSLRLILPVMSVCSDLQLEEHGIVTALIELMKECDAEDGICLLILETLAYVMEAKDVDFTWLYTLGVPEQLSLLILKLGVTTSVPEQTALAGIRCLGALLHYVMSVVKKALQSKNKAVGEQILQSTKCIVNTCGVLLVWYHFTTATTTLLSITQLYGGQYRDFLTPYNVDILASSLKDDEEWRVKTTLKILKRISTADPDLLQNMLSGTREQLNRAVVAVKANYPTLVGLAEEVSKLVTSKS